MTTLTPEELAANIRRYLIANHAVYLSLETTNEIVEMCLAFRDKQQAEQIEAEKRRAVNEALDLLDILFSAYEDGLPCEEVDGGYVGNAVDLDEETFDKIADLLNRERPRVLKEKPND